MYIINEFQLQAVDSSTYIFSDAKAAKISHQVLTDILSILQQQPKLEINEDDLASLASDNKLSLEQLKHILINQLDILRPLAARKFRHVYLNIEDSCIKQLLAETFSKHYTVHMVEADFYDYNEDSLVIFYRSNYSSQAFETLYHHLPDKVYLITAGVVHKILVIDNLYYNQSGLPSHVSNMQQLMAFLKSDMPTTKDNWLLFYRSLVKNNQSSFPEPVINACQKGFIAYALFQFASQYSHFWKVPTTLDKVNWFWHVDLTSFHVHQEVAVHSAFSKYDMNLNLSVMKQPEMA